MELPFWFVQHKGLAIPLVAIDMVHGIIRMEKQTIIQKYWEQPFEFANYEFFQNQLSRLLVDESYILLAYNQFDRSQTSDEIMMELFEYFTELNQVRQKYY